MLPLLRCGLVQVEAADPWGIMITNGEFTSFNSWTPEVADSTQVSRGRLLAVAMQLCVGPDTSMARLGCEGGRWWWSLLTSMAQFALSTQPSGAQATTWHASTVTVGVCAFPKCSSSSTVPHTHPSCTLYSSSNCQLLAVHILRLGC